MTILSPFLTVSLVMPRRSRMLGLPASIAQFTTVPSGLFHVDMDPAVGVDQLDLGDRGVLELDRLVRVEFRREGMMRPHGRNTGYEDRPNG